MKLRISLFVAAALFLFGAPALASDYLPIEEGNDWQYTTPNGSSKAATDSTGTASGRTYYHYSNFVGLGDQWLTYGASGQVGYWNSNLGRPVLLLDTDDAVGTTYKTPGLHNCATELSIASKGDVIETPVGHFSDTVAISVNPGSCRDVGTSMFWLARDVGVVQYETITIAGPTRHVLNGATVDGKTYEPAPKPKAPFTMSMTPSRDSMWLNMMPSIDGPRDHDTSVTTTFTLHNTSDQSMTLTFNTSQRFDIVATDAAGQEVARWSANKRFMQVVEKVTVMPGDNVSFEGTINLPAAEGQYNLRMELSNENRHFAAETSVDVMVAY